MAMRFERRREWRLVLTVSVILIFISGVTYFLGYLWTPPGAVYTGLHALTPGDFNVYYTQMRQAARGDLFITNPYAGADGAGSASMANHFWLLLGTAAGVAHLPIPLVFHTVRLLFIPCLVWVGYRLLKLLAADEDMLYAGLMALFGSGLGFFAMPFLEGTFSGAGRYEWPTDLWVPESNTFLTLYHSPHLLASLTLFLTVVWCFLESLRSARPIIPRLFGSLALAALLLFHPFQGPTLAALVTGWTIAMGARFLWRSVVTAVCYALAAAPVAWWHMARMGNDWIVWEWARQNITLTPSILMVLIGFGFLIPLAGIGVSRVMHDRRYLYGTHALMPHAGRLLTVWLLVQGILIYSPIPFQRRMLEGIHFPLAALAGIGIAPFLRPLLARSSLAARMAVAVVAVLLASSTLGTLARDIALFRQQEPLLYLRSADRIAFATLQREISPGVVLAGVTTASMVPAWTDRTVYGAPGAFSPGYWDIKYPLIQWFFDGRGNSEQRKRFLARERITSIIVTPFDHLDIELLRRDELLKIAYEHDGTAVFFVK